MATDTLPLRFFESHRITVPEGGVFFDASGSPVIEDTLASVMSKMKTPQIQAKAKASSSGVLINGRVYPGMRMKDSVHHFTKDHGKPVLNRHPINLQDQPERVGRVTSAEYFQTMTDKMWMTDFKRPKPNGHAGSGHIILGTLISGHDNVQRVVDKRDLTLSVGFTPTAFFCSICMHDWVAQGEPCGHEPMKIYEIDDAKGSGAFVCFGITGLLIYDHVANVNFPADPTAQFLSTSFQDAASNLDYFTSRAADSYQSHLAGFVLTDAADNRVLELQLDPPPVATHEAPHRQDEAQLMVAVDFDRNSPKEIPMADTNKNATAPKTAVPPTTDAAPPAEGDPKVVDAAAAATQQTDVKPAGEGQDNASAWTQPDPIDGHTHGIASLDSNGGGETTMATGNSAPDHSHIIQHGRVRPSSGGEEGSKYVSRHPDSYFYDEEGATKSRMLDESTDVDGKPVLTDDKKDDVPPADTHCVDGCTFDFAADDLDKDFVLSDTLEDNLEVLGQDEMADLVDEYDSHAAGKMTDAPLTAAQRRKVPDRFFCGPNRTFPAHDGVRVLSGLARLADSKNFTSAQKAGILTCLKRRAKTLGVEVSGTDQATAAGTLMDGPDQAILKTLGKDIEQKTAKINLLESSVDEKTKELTATTTQLQDAETANLKLRIDSILTMKMALKKPDMVDCKTDEDMKKVRDELAQRSVDSLDDFARELQIELAGGGMDGALMSSSVEPPASGVGSLGAAPTSEAGGVDKTLADATLDRFKSL